MWHFFPVGRQRELEKLREDYAKIPGYDEKAVMEVVNALRYVRFVLH